MIRDTIYRETRNGLCDHHLAPAWGRFENPFQKAPFPFLSFFIPKNLGSKMQSFLKSKVRRPKNLQKESSIKSGFPPTRLLVCFALPSKYGNLKDEEKMA